MDFTEKFISWKCLIYSSIWVVFCRSRNSVFRWKANVRLKGLHYGVCIKNLTYAGKEPIWKDYKDVFSYCDLCLFEWEVGWRCLTLTWVPWPQCGGHGVKLMIMSCDFDQALLGHGIACSCRQLVAAIERYKSFLFSVPCFQGLVGKRKHIRNLEKCSSAL